MAGWLLNHNVQLSVVQGGTFYLNGVSAAGIFIILTLDILKALLPIS